MWQRSLLSEYTMVNPVPLINLIIMKCSKENAKHLTYQCGEDLEISHQPRFTVWPTYPSICYLMMLSVIQTAYRGSWVYLMIWYSKTGKQKNLYPYWEFNVSPSPQPVSVLTYFLPWLIWSTIECEKYRYAITNKIMLLHITYSPAVL